MASEHNIFEHIGDWLGYVAAALMSLVTLAASTITGTMYRRYSKDRERLTAVEAKTEELDIRLGTVAEAVETVIERQDEMRDSQEDMRNDVTEIKTDVKWMVRRMDSGIKDT